MILSDLLNSPKAHHVNGRAIEITVIGRNQQAEVVQVQDRVRFRFVSEQERADLFAKADAVVNARYSGRPPADRQQDERNYHVLHAALRDADNPSRPFAESVSALCSALVLAEAQRVFQEFDKWVDEEFPASVPEDEMAALVEEAKKNSVDALLRSRGYKQTLSALRSLAATSGLLPTPT